MKVFTEKVWHQLSALCSNMPVKILFLRLLSPYTVGIKIRCDYGLTAGLFSFVVSPDGEMVSKVFTYCTQSLPALFHV